MGYEVGCGVLRFMYDELNDDVYSTAVSMSLKSEPIVAGRSAIVFGLTFCNESAPPYNC